MHYTNQIEEERSDNPKIHCQNEDATGHKPISEEQEDIQYVFTS